MYKYKKENAVFCASQADVHFNGECGFLFDRFIFNRVTSKFAIEKILKEAEDAFERKSDIINPYVGMWQGEFWGKLMISGCRTCRYTHDENLKNALLKSAYRLMSFQEPSGYLGTYSDPTFLFGNPEKAREYMHWACDFNWNIWCRKYTLWGMLECYLLTGDQNVLTCAKKSVDQLIAMLDEIHVNICETGTFFGIPSGSILKPLLILFEITQDQKYLDFALNIADSFEGEEPDCAKPIRAALNNIPPATWPLIVKDPKKRADICSKAYETMSLFDGVIELYRVTGNEKYLTAAKNFFDLLIKYEYNSIFSVGFNDLFLNAAFVQDSISEPCDVIHFMRLASELFAVTKDIKYMNYFERAFLNPFLAGVNRDGVWGARGVRATVKHMFAHGQSGMEYSHCCVNNMPRGFINAAEYIAAANDNQVYLNMFVPASIKLCNGEINICISDGYTQYQKTSVTIENSGSKKQLLIRIPEWSNKTQLIINGKEYSPECNKYFETELDNGTTNIQLQFDSSVVVNSKIYYRDLHPMTFYHIARYRTDERWSADAAGDVALKLITKNDMLTFCVGPMLLTLSHELNPKVDIFELEAIKEKFKSITLEPLPKEQFMSAYKATIDCGDETKEYILSDFASSTNHDVDGGYTIFF